MASRDNPEYSAVIVTKSGARYNITSIMTGVETAEEEGQVAQRVTVSFFNAPNGSAYLNEAIDVMDRMYLYASDGNSPKEVFRGFIWEIEYSSDLEKILSATCYDNLIFFQESEESKFFAKGQSTSQVTSSLCADWGVKQNYTYDSITHDKLTLQGTLSDIFLNDLLGEVKKAPGSLCGRVRILSILRRLARTIRCIRCIKMNGSYRQIAEFLCRASSQKSRSWAQQMTAGQAILLR